jgi:hypothetical protein
MVERQICWHCKKQIEGKIYDYYGFYDMEKICESCWNRQTEIAIEEAWNWFKSGSGLTQVKCIKCGQELDKNQIYFFGFEDEHHTSFKCSNEECEFEFTLRHNEPPCEDPYEYQEQEEAREYKEAMKSYNERLKQWEENGSLKGQRPIPPRSPEEKMIDDANLRKYGEY